MSISTIVSDLLLNLDGNTHSNINPKNYRHEQSSSTTRQRER
jgi:hypothetical protein